MDAFIPLTLLLITAGTVTTILAAIWSRYEHT